MTNSFTDDINDNFESVKSEIESIKTNYTPLQVTNAINSTIANIPSKTSDLTNDSGFITGISSANVTSALGFTPYNSTNPNGYITGVNSGDITSALGYTPTTPANVDGQWVWSYSVVWSSAAAGDFTVNLGTTGISPKNYLPQDNYSYLVQFTASLTNSATTASALVLKNSSYGSDVVQLCCANKDSAYSDNAFFIIVDSSRTIDFKLGYAAARFSITAMGYRRIGTNT